MTDTASDVHRSSVTYPRAFVRRVASVTRALPAGGPVTEADLDGLPAAAVRYLRFMNVVGKARTGSLLAAAHGRFRMRPDGRWMACRTWQLNTAVPVRRLFHMHLRVAPGVAMTGWDTYADGCGQMRGKLFGALGDRLVDAESGFQADDQEVEGVRQAVADLLLPLRDEVADHERRNHVADDGGHDSEDHPLAPSQDNERHP